ncbi:integrator complex subunit 6-like [Daphnia carinata]|uniref:integrator complex subunit 6-like n=1 Tax=Daphnia carinata TaxID=120202 RepID=UPI002579E60E|nr:integrator complex subunit 6-like [Daphnia carinata]
MTIIVFLVDTSASMNQRAYLGGRPSLLDVAKGAVETFVKIRQRSPESRGDRYMLLTFEEPPFNIKAGWKENLGTFMNELKNLQATGLSTLGVALKSAFDLLNVNRMQTGIDMYGQGRHPFFLEPAVIVAITDGGKLAYNGGIHDELNLPMNNNIPGAELTREPFRWDQRLFSLVLRLTGTPPLERDPMGLVPSDTSPIDTMCEVTGGRSYAITSHRMLMQCVDSLVQKIQSGVVIYFEKIGPDPPLLAEGKADCTNGEVLLDEDSKAIFSGSSWQVCRRMIYVPRSAQKGFAVGFWPIPEAFWPDVNAPSLSPRTAHPVVQFTCTNQEPMIIENLPFDKYEVEPCPLTQYILSRKQASTCWQVFVPNSYRSSESGHPFGYLKASTNLQSVNLFVMPYNYPALLPLLDELFRVHRLRPTADWRGHFANYLRTMPPYYAAPLRRALTRMGAPNLASTLIPESLDNNLSYSIVNYLKRLKHQAKVEFDRVCSEVGRNRQVVVDSIKVIPRSAFRKDFISNPTLIDKFLNLRDQMSDFPGFALALKEREMRAQNLRNPFDIPRSTLLDQVARMRANFLQPSLAHTRLQDEDDVHSMPVGQMGNYQEYLKRIAPPLREIESTPVRQHMFGNPFKIDKRMMVDEADIDLVGGSASQTSGRGTKRPAESPNPIPFRPSKRKAGPLPRDLCVRRPFTPLSSASTSPSPPPSPIPSLPGDVQIRPDSHLPGVNSPVFPSPTIDHFDSEDESHSLVIAECNIDAPPETSLVNGLTKTTSTLEDVPPCELQIIISPSLQALHNNGAIVTPETLVPASAANHFVNGDVKDLYANHGNTNYAFLNCVSGVGDQLPLNGTLLRPEIQEIQQHNLQVKSAACRAIKRPGRNFNGVFNELSRLKGSLDLRKSIVMDIVNECLRFKRRILADLVKQFLNSLGRDPEAL